VDVTDLSAQTAAMSDHMSHFGRMDLAVINAGIAEAPGFYQGQPPEQWVKVLRIDLEAAVGGVQSAACCMAAAPQPGGMTIITLASAAGQEHSRNQLSPAT
jgi:NADP-dependent 3-hydroxy acid dehydrogenase YdfG